MGEGAAVAKRASLTDFAAKKPQPAEEAPEVSVSASVRAAAAEGGKVEGRRGQTLRLTPAAWRQLKQLALVSDQKHIVLFQRVTCIGQKLVN